MRDEKPGSEAWEVAKAAVGLALEDGDEDPAWKEGKLPWMIEDLVGPDTVDGKGELSSCPLRESVARAVPKILRTHGWVSWGGKSWDVLIPLWLRRWGAREDPVASGEGYLWRGRIRCPLEEMLGGARRS